MTPFVIGEERCELVGRYITETGDTVRGTAKKFGISKSTVHTAVTLSNGSCGWWRRNNTAKNKKIGGRERKLLTAAVFTGSYFNDFKAFLN